jgi:hypothetical protein
MISNHVLFVHESYESLFLKSCMKMSQLLLIDSFIRIKNISHFMKVDVTRMPINTPLFYDVFACVDKNYCRNKRLFIKKK